MSPPETIAHYRITSKLGEGGMGAVYRATDTKLNRDVAIKVIPDSFAQDADRMARFTREAQVLASLNHPNIAVIHGVEERAIVMELVEGGTLSGPLSLEDALPIIQQLIDALEYAHEKGVVHRDLKPANIKVTPEGRVKVLDFGLAKAMSEDSPAGHPASSPTLTMRATMAGTIMGTAAYMAPEQARGHIVDKRADIWAFGVVVYEIVTGRQLFEGPSVSDTLASVLKETPDWEPVPQRMRKLLRLCLEKDPRRRLRDIGDARALMDEETHAPVASQPSSSRLPWAVAAVSTMALALAGILLWKVTRPVDRPLARFSVDLGPEAVPDTERTAILSPDGTRLAHLVRPVGAISRIATRLLDQRQTTTLPGTENATLFFFSPDGQWIGFFSNNQLKKVPAAGGAVITLCDANLARGAAWAEDNTIIASINRRLFRVPAAGGQPEPLTPPGEGRLAQQRTPQVLPGGQSVLFTAAPFGPEGYENSSIQVFSMKTRQIKEIARGYYARYLPSGHLAYVREGVLVAQPFDLASLEIRGAPVPVVEDIAANPATGMGQYGFSNNGTLVYFSGTAITPGWELAWMDRSGKTQTLPIPLGTNFSPRLSPDGRRLMLSVGSPDLADLWLFDFDRSNLSRVTLDRKGHYYSVWAPDSKHVVYLSYDGASFALWWVRADGASEPQQLFESKDRIVPSSFSPDGRRLAFHQSGAGTSLDLWTLPLDISDPEHPKPGRPEPFLNSPAGEAQPAFSPDGKWIAYGATDTGKIELYVRPFPGPGGRWLISNGGGDYPVWTRDGRTLLYMDGEGRIMEVDYQVKGDSFVHGKPHPWIDARFEMVNTGTGRRYDISPDGKRLIVPYLPAAAEEKKGNVHVTFLLNFFDELKRRMP